MEYCKKTFVKLFEIWAWDFARYSWKEGTTIEYFYNNRLTSIHGEIKEFYTCASKIRSLEKMMSEEEVDVDALTLWDLFKDRSNAERVKQALIVNNRWGGVGSFFTPMNLATKTEPISLYYAIKKLQFLDTKEMPAREVIAILKRTFKDFSCTEKTYLKGKNDIDTTDYYRALCKFI